MLRFSRWCLNTTNHLRHWSLSMLMWSWFVMFLFQSDCCWDYLQDRNCVQWKQTIKTKRDFTFWRQKAGKTNLPQNLLSKQNTHRENTKCRSFLSGMLRTRSITYLSAFVWTFHCGCIIKTFVRRSITWNARDTHLHKKIDVSLGWVACLLGCLFVCLICDSWFF